MRNKNGTWWFDAGPFPVYIGVCLSDRAYAREVRRLAVDKPDPFLSPDAYATAHTFVCDKRTPSLVVLLAFCRRRARGKSAGQLANIFAHEGVHCARSVFEHIGEKRIGEETEAYLVGYFAQCGLSALQAEARARKKPKKAGKKGKKAKARA